MTRPILLRAVLTLAMFWCLDLAVFHTRLYPSIIEPDSTTGSIETRLTNETERATGDRNQVVAVGDSRMALNPRLANALIHETGYTFATISVGGTTPRCWYYQLRAADPAAHRYAAVIVPSSDYDEADEYESRVNRPYDLHYVLAELRLTDLLEFSASFRAWDMRRTMAESILFKGLVYRRDLHELLLQPAKRRADIKLNYENSASWAYDFEGEQRSLAGVSVDWGARIIHFPNGFPPDQQELTRGELLRPRPPQTGETTRYCRYWYGRILAYYHGSGTKVIFVQVPRWPLPIPGFEIHNLNSAARACRSNPDAIVLDERLLEPLERPEFFMDGIHLNREGTRRFTEILAREVRRVLGPGHPSED